MFLVPLFVLAVFWGIPQSPGVGLVHRSSSGPQTPCSPRLWRLQCEHSVSMVRINFSVFLTFLGSEFQ